MAVSRGVLCDALAESSHQTWMLQAERDKGISRDTMSAEVTDHDRERADEAVAVLERLQVWSDPSGKSPARLELEDWLAKILAELDEDKVDDEGALHRLEGMIATAAAEWRVQTGYSIGGRP
jgi:hypothetical protein